MPRFDAFCGPTNTAFSPNISSELTMNWIPARNAVSVNGQGDEVTDKNVRCSLIRTPGLKTFITLPQSPVRGLCPGEQRLFAAAGNHYYEIMQNGTYVDRSVPGFSGSSGIGAAGGPIGNDGNPVEIALNGFQALIVSAGSAYYDNGNGPVAAQFSDKLSDLVVDPADTTGFTLTTATGNYFDASDAGRTVIITTGYGFNGYTPIVIQSVNAQGEAIGSQTWGVPGSTLGGGIEYLGMISYSDLQLVAPSSTQIHSATRVFGPSEVGQTLTITGGAGWTPGSYVIGGLVVDASNNPTGDAILSRAAGSPGATGGTGSLTAQMVTASHVAFLDGYFFVTPQPRTRTIYYSAIDDGTSWDPLDSFIKHNCPDNVSTLIADHEELYTLGDMESTEVWRDVGNADNPFAPDQGAAMHVGCQAQYSPVRLGNGVAWIGQDMRRGSRKAIHAVGFTPQIVSTPAIEAQWVQYTNVSDAVSFSYSDAGHEYWVINFPSANATWVYDVTTGWWHQRGWWNTTNSSWDRIRVWMHAVVALGGGPDAHYVGDWQTGQIYTMSRAFKTDDGALVVRRRMAPHLTRENMRRFYSRFEIDCDVLGNQRIYWNRLGNGRDRIWRLDSSQSSETTGVTVTLGWSDDKTQSFQTVFTQSLDPSVDVSIANAYLNWVDATWH